MDPPLTFVGLLSSRTRITSFARNFLSHKKEEVAFLQPPLSLTIMPLFSYIFLFL